MDLVDMWHQMGLVAQAVVVLLGVMSVWSIGVMVERYLTYRAARNQSRQFAPAVAEALGRGNLREALEIAEQYNKSHLAKVVHAGLQEFQAQEGGGPSIPGQTIDASKRALQRATALGIEEFKRGLGGLATIGSTAPFVGLFGTTVGIINAFTGMSRAEGMGLAAVAGGISRGPRGHRLWSFRGGSGRMDVQLLHGQDRIFCGGDGQLVLRVDRLFPEEEGSQRWP